MNSQNYWFPLQRIQEKGIEALSYVLPAAIKSPL